ncbi:MAG TPA: Gfo/Idh/MocA family oxidoreductase [Candidatus Lokiarchaeia archaeon]|nr:Gfo/Idh/MocA family oxidoreductase [Candidatus Lokiarchaeia archaeon]
MKVHNFAVIGVGGRGGDWVKELSRNQEVKLLAVMDIDEKRVKKVAEECGATPYLDAEEMFQQEKLDGVVIATPHYMHAPYTVMAAEHDVNVISEKPMAITLQQCDEMIIACRKHAVKLAIGFQHRFNPTHQYIYDAARGAKGELGTIGRVTDWQCVTRHYRGDLYYLSSSPVDPKTGVKAGPWRGRWSTEGAGILINQAVHELDLFQWMVGPLRSLSAHAATISKEHALIEVEDTVAVSFESLAGAVGTMIFTSSNKKSEKNKFVVHGTEGYVEEIDGMVTMDTRYKNEEDYEVPFTQPARQNVLENFIDAVDKDTEPMVPGEEGRKAIEVIRAILKSVETDQAVYFPVKDSSSFPTVINVYRDKPFEF